MSLPCLGHPCPDILCSYCEAAIDAAEDEPTYIDRFDGPDADREADRYFDSLQRNRL